MMLDFTNLIGNKKTMKVKLSKNLSFLNRMVRIVFYSTFLFTVAIMVIAWFKGYEQLLNTLTERWFTIMVGELVIMGFIQITKEIVQAVITKGEYK